MPAPSEISWDMYDPRLTIKAEAAEGLTRGECVWIHTDGLAYLCDDAEYAKFHGCVLKDTDSGDLTTIVTHGRLYTTAAQTIGAEAKVPNSSGGGPPSTAAGGTAVAGFAIAAYLIFVHVGRGTDT